MRCNASGGTPTIVNCADLGSVPVVSGAGSLLPSGSDGIGADSWGIDPEVAGDVEMLQDMVMAAFNEAAKKVDEQIQSKMGGMLGGMGLPPGLI